MITQKDIHVLKDTFATKEDLRVVKEDLLEAMDKQKDEIIEAVADTIRDGINPVLDNHEGRIKKLEKRIPAVA